MQDKDFDKIFGHKFGQLGGEPPRDEHWTDLAERLEADKNRRSRWFLPVWWPVFGLLLAGNGFWWHQWRTADTRANSVAAAQVDTVVRRTVVVYDTVYQTLVRTRTVEHTQFGPSANAQFFAQKTAPASALPGVASIEKNSGEVAPKSNTPLASAEAQKPENQSLASEIQLNASQSATQPETSDSLENEQTKIAQTPHPHHAPDTVFEKLLATPPPLAKRKQPFHFQFSRPRVGLSAGWASPQFSGKKSGAGTFVGLVADAEIGRKIRLVADVQYLRGRMKSDQAEAIEEYATIPNPGSDYALRYWEVYKLSALTYSAQLRVELPVLGKFSPYIGLGGQAATLFPFEVEYEFESASGDIEIFRPGLDEPEPETRWQGTLFSLGGESRLSKRFSLGAQAFWLHNWGGDPHPIDRQFGLKTNLLYHF